MKHLRSDLFHIQVEGHAKELHRLVSKKDGKVYFTVEFFRTVPDSGDYFIVHEIPVAMSALGEFFHFDFKETPPSETNLLAGPGEGVSLVHSCVLLPKDI